MSITRGVLAQSPEPKIRDEFKGLTDNPDRIGIWKSRSKDENQQQTQPTYDAECGNRRPHWWEMSALNTAPWTPVP